VVRYYTRNGRQVVALAADDPEEIAGINTPAQLEAARRVLSGRGS
jgi:bifunctional N-acetylglucosamine-1-phosphate-uridyltransferase/glucosamine-1-phosphate-acetyltransferase GlmU-like protein